MVYIFIMDIVFKGGGGREESRAWGEGGESVCLSLIFISFFCLFQHVDWPIDPSSVD